MKEKRIDNLKIEKEKELNKDITFRPKISSKSNLLAKHSDRRDFNPINSKNETPAPNYKPKLEMNYREISNDSSSFNLQTKIKEKLNNSSSTPCLSSNQLKGLKIKLNKLQKLSINVTTFAEDNDKHQLMLRD